MNKLKKIMLIIENSFLSIMQRINYPYFKKHYPFYLRRLGVNFSGNISETGFVSPTVSFDSKDYAKFITIGERTIISGSVLFLVHDYSIGSAMCYKRFSGVKHGHLPHMIKEIKVGNDCFIGIRSIILPGTIIGDGVIIGAGSVVKGNIPSGVIVAGNPGKVICKVDEYVEKHVHAKDFIY